MVSSATDQNRYNLYASFLQRDDSMILKVLVNEQTHQVKVPDNMLTDGEEFFRKVDSDMDKGWQMSRQWVDHPNELQRCQIAADKMLTAIETENQGMTMLMAAYILKRMPGITAIDIDTTGDMTQTNVVMRDVSEG